MPAPSQPLHAELQRMIESLAHCICATEEPQVVLDSLVAQLHREVEVTNRTANVHLHRRRTTPI